MVTAAFADRPLKKLCLFDVDGTLSLARQVRDLRHLSLVHSALHCSKRRQK